jgi:7,8-dihydropterin-6-yl-methyl-4-(beta-D-ribofuranosyl)aminobenzene 5'-phosphate synthase
MLEAPSREGFMPLTALALTLSLLAAPLSTDSIGTADSIGSASASPARITILYDAFGGAPGLTQDWGFAALIEYGGHRILFDTGDNAAIFARNVQRLHVDLRRLDFAVVSHRHGDHIGGLSYLLKVNPKIRIYAPRENFGVFGWSLPSTFYRTAPALPQRMRYYNGAPAAELRFGTAWPEARFTLIDSLTDVAPGVTLVSTVSQTPGTFELHELSLVLRTPTGAVVVVGCSHPGIETILRAASAVTPDVALIVGGLHWVTAPDSTIARLTDALHDEWHVKQIGPGHCTGEPAFAALQSKFGSDYLYAGLGSVLVLRHGDSPVWARLGGPNDR